ncbi:DUF1648 domain-containing protein [Baaleninema sp.]|uniref:DUF1648 domain-containing protein n=1 Tax=Baaleninema sp. TaxID=3101197 RepID=UPI003D08C8FD
MQFLRKIFEKPKAISTAFYGSVLVGFVTIAIYYPLLPERMASHFRFDGTPDAWSSKTVFALINLALLAFVAFIFWGLDRLIQTIPVSSIKLPNKEYWLEPSRRDRTILKVIALNYLIGIATNVLLIYIEISTFNAHLSSGTPRLGFEIWMAIALYVLVTVLLSLSPIFIFKRG